MLRLYESPYFFRIFAIAILSMESSLLLEFGFGFLPFLPYFRFAHFLAWLLLLHYYFVYSTNKYYHK
jgi:hypothetical protein